LMPDFSGIEKAESTRDWDASFPLVYKMRPKDEQYWKERKGTPKAFVTLTAGQRMWANRFGNVTAIRLAAAPAIQLPGAPSSIYQYVPGAPDGPAGEQWSRFKKAFLATLKPEEIGLRFEPVREQALQGAEQSQDFGQLFLGFSIFLIVAALLLMALLFQFGLERRMTEVGTLLALGFTTREVRRLFLIEGAVLALLGSIAGLFAGMGYARAMLLALTTVWKGATGTSMLRFHVTGSTLAIGAGSGALVAVITIWLTLRKQARRPARELLGVEVQSPEPRVQSRGRWIALTAGLPGLGLIGLALVRGDTSNAETFFWAGTLLLIAGLALAAAWLGALARNRGGPRFTLGDLGVRGCARRRKRSLATIALLAFGSFVILAIGVFRLDANQNAYKRSSGTGGFALIGESTMPIVQNLNSQPGREAFGLSAKDLAGVGIVQFRVREGDEASCLNLNRAQKPRLLGVRPEALAGRFTFAKIEKQKAWEPWESLRGGKDQGEIPAIGDANSIEWALGKKVGDTLDYTDEHGRTFKLRLVGAVANSILQGSLIIDEAEFVKRFTSASGYRMFLIDCPSNAVTQVSGMLSRALQDAGLELTPAARRLNAFNAVQNTYLGTFQILGGLGLLLGSAGLGVVVLRNVLERRGELGLLAAVGFRRRSLQRLVLSEHAMLLGLGLGIGMAAAAVAVLPALLAPGTQLPYVSLAMTLGAVLLNGFLWTWVATRFALRGNLLAALRNE
jgi:ABC-type antimicrobial peptide transport system permease subunit